MIRVVLFLSLLIGLCDIATAGARKDYEGSAECERSLEGINSEHFLDANRIYYEADTGLVILVTSDTSKATDYIIRPRILELIPAKIGNKLTFAAGTDPRIEQVRQFLEKHRSPAAKYAELFIQVADDNDLDWKLLPMLSFIETGGGRYKNNNNIFGWDSGRKKFHSVEEGIRYVGHALQSGPYRNKTLLQKLKVYNTYKHYTGVALRVMKQIENTPVTFPSA